MSKPLLQPNKFKNSLEDKSGAERRKSNEGLDDPKSPRIQKNDNMARSPKATSPTSSGGSYGK